MTLTMALLFIMFEILLFINKQQLKSASYD